MTAPPRGTPVQIRSFATLQKSPTDVTPSCGNTATADATKIVNIHGDATFANWAIRSKPSMAKTVTTAPTMNTTATHPTAFGIRSSRPGISMPSGRPTAVAATEIMAPARKQNISALTML